MPTSMLLGRRLTLAWIVCAGCNREATSLEAPTAGSARLSAALPSAAPSGHDAPGAVDLCVGASHTCVVTSTGRVACWGDNDWHQVSPDDVAQTSAPTRALGVPIARRVICGATSTCSIATTGEVWCWGAERARANDGAAPIRLDLHAPTRELVLTPSGGCAIDEHARVSCFVRSFGALRPVAVPGTEHATGFATSEAASDPSRVCVLRDGLPTVCFRPTANTPPKGRPDPEASHEPVIFMDRVEGPAPPSPPSDLLLRAPAGLNVKRASRSHACGIDDTGGVHCWGLASSGQLGDRAPHLHPTARVPDVDDARSLAVGEGGACVARRSGAISCWGRLRDEDPPRPMRDVGAPWRSDQVALGASLLNTARLCAREEGTLVWRCLLGEEWLAVPPAFVGSPKPALVDARGATWNLNVREEPSRDFFFSQVKTAVTALSRDGYCAVDTSGRIVCGHCGACDSPRDAMTTIIASEPFVQVGSLTYDEALESTVCGLTASGRSMCNQIARAPFEHSEPKAFDVSGLPADGVEIAASGGRYEPNLTCIRTRGGEVHCFGDHRHGQHAGAERQALRVQGLPSVVEIGSAGSFACAREASGAVWCWGSNRDGGAPDGTPLERPAGIAVRLEMGGTTAASPPK